MKHNIVELLTVLLLAFALSAVNGALPEHGQASPPAIAPDPTDIEEIKTIIARSYELTAIAARTFDVAKFPSVYVSDPSVSLSDEQAAFLRRALPNSANGQGMLDEMTVEYTQWKVGAERLEQLEVTAKAQGRKLRGSDLISTAGPVGPPRRTDPIYTTKIRFDDFQVVGHHVEVILDDGAALQRMTMVKTPSGWRIAGLRYLNAHF